MEFYEIIILLFLGMLLFMPAAFICFLSGKRKKERENTENKNNDKK